VVPWGPLIPPSVRSLALWPSPSPPRPLCRFKSRVP
jgi:hypothetical protein